MEGDEASF